MLLVFLLNVFGYSSLEGPVLAVASIALAGYLFFFLLAFKLTGPLVVIISRTCCPRMWRASSSSTRCF